MQTMSERIKDITNNDPIQYEAYQQIHHFVQKKLLSKKETPIKSDHIDLIAMCTFATFKYLSTYYNNVNSSYKNIQTFLNLLNDRINSIQFEKMSQNRNGIYYPRMYTIGIADRLYSLSGDNTVFLIHTVTHELLHAITPYNLLSSNSKQAHIPECINKFFSFIFYEKYYLLMEYVNEQITINIGIKYLNFPLSNHTLYIVDSKNDEKSIHYQNYAHDYSVLIACNELFNYIFADKLEIAHLSPRINIGDIIKEQNLKKWHKHLIHFLRTYKKLYSDYSKFQIKRNRYNAFVNAYQKMIKEYILTKNLSPEKACEFEYIATNTPVLYLYE